ncbi:phosphoenolpyruvate carboxylase kinase 2-like [Setaria viridis]|uniref:phosphoenolpyruvate carboxylase kinase 2-like n=1 Tax=Setaria viridis TaxID=4556 RepID=UPI001493CC5F|nr:phosphoenolpyruvate carboxylase kinase 2-like [Setaria viridis]
MPHYVVPEVVFGSEYDAKANMWSVGVVMYALLSRDALSFGGESAAEVLAVVMRGGVRFLPRLFGGVSPTAKDLTRRMICRDEWRRFTAEQNPVLTLKKYNMINGNKLWIRTSEYAALPKNQTWTLVPPKKGVNLIDKV